MAIACFRLVTFRPLPDFSVPRLVRRTAVRTLSPAALPYLRRLDVFRADVDFRAVPAVLARAVVVRAAARGVVRVVRRVVLRRDVLAVVLRRVDARTDDFRTDFLAAALRAAMRTSPVRLSR